MTIDFNASFPSFSEQDWRLAVEVALKGKPFEKTLVGKTHDGLRVEPLYAQNHTHLIPSRPAQSPWSVVQRVDMADVHAANRQAREDLEGGASALSFVFKGSLGAYNGHGLILKTEKDIKALFENVYLNLIPVRFDGAETPFFEKLKNATKGLDVNFTLGHDPLSHALSHGEKAHIDASTLLPLNEMGRLFMADGRLVHSAGGSDAQELAYVLYSGVTYLRQLVKAGFRLDEARHKLSFMLNADAHQFLTIAKFRALRLLWARVEEVTGLIPEPIDLHGETAWRMMTKLDANVNWLRTTLAAFSAGLGGANHITVLPHSLPFGVPDDASRRMARNIQLVLIEEANLHQVSDPASGAGSVESLTLSLAETAWQIFQNFENEGFQPQSFARSIQKVAQERTRNIAKRKEVLTGTSEFPEINEQAPHILQPAYAIASTRLSAKRFSEPFEVLRAKNQAANARIFLCTLGNLAEFNARATYAKNFFETGGIEALANDGFSSDEKRLSAFLASGTKLVCLCGNDESYAQSAENMIRTLKKSGAKGIYLAGRLDEARFAQLQALGLTDYIFSGCDVLEKLSAIQS